MCDVRHVGLLLGSLFVAGAIPAQGVAEHLAAARDLIDDGEHEQALPILRKVAAMASSSEEREQVTWVLHRVADALLGEARFQQALAACETMLELQRAMYGGGDHVRVAGGLHNVAFCQLQLGQLEEALSSFEAAVAMWRRLPETDPTEVARALNCIGGCLLDLGRAAEALPNFEEGLAMRRHIGAERDIAISLDNTGRCLATLERHGEALPRHEEALAIFERIHAGRQHRDVAASLGLLATCLEELDRHEDALQAAKRALAINRRIYAGRAHPDLATSLGTLGRCLEAVGRPVEALPYYEQRLAMDQAIHGEEPHPAVASSLNNVGYCLASLGRHAEALARHQAALAMHRALHGTAPHPGVVASLANVATCLRQLGRAEEALAPLRESLVLSEQIHGATPRAGTADDLTAMAHCLDDLGRLEEAVPFARSALAMARSVHAGDHTSVAHAMDGLAHRLLSLGRAGEALPLVEAALAMSRRLHGTEPHPEVAMALNNLALCLGELGRLGEQRVRFEEALQMLQHVYGGEPEGTVLATLNNLAFTLQELGEPELALVRYEESLAIQARIHGDAPHPKAVLVRNNKGHCLMALGRFDEAAQELEAALAMARRLYPGRDHPLVALALRNVSVCLASRGHEQEALDGYEAALAMLQRLYAGADHRFVAMSLCAKAACLRSLGRRSEALATCQEAAAMIERLRERLPLSGALQQSFFDDLKRSSPFELLQLLALELDRPDAAFRAAERSRGRWLLDLLEQSRRDPLDDVLRVAAEGGDDGLRDRVQALRAELQANLLEGDRLLHLVSRLDDAEPAPEHRAQRDGLMAAAATVNQRRGALLDERARLVGDGLPVGRVREAVAIQAALAPGELVLEFVVSEEIAVLYLLGPEGTIEALPLPTAAATVQRVLPLVLASAAQPAPTRGRDPEEGPVQHDSIGPSRELFASLVPAGLWPRLRSAQRVFVAAHRGLHRLPFELLVTDVKDGKPVYWLDHGPAVAYVPSGSALHWLRARATAAGEREAAFEVVAIGDPALDREAPQTTAQGSPSREHEIERLRDLPQLRHARAEAEDIVEMAVASGGKAQRLLGAEATEVAVADFGARAEFLHFACHGIAEEYAGQSLSMLVLAAPESVVAGDDGLLGMDDLLHRWRGHLSSCRLVVLSACRTNVGPTLRDEAPQALPIGFLFAGAPAVISSLWAVDDASTKELMTDFYGRLLGGETDKLAAFTAAKKALRAKYPDPFHWAPFLYLGVPE